MDLSCCFVVKKKLCPKCVYYVVHMCTTTLDQYDHSDSIWEDTFKALTNSRDKKRERIEKKGFENEENHIGLPSI